MRKTMLIIGLALAAAACTEKPAVELDEAFDIEQPKPTQALTRMTLDERQKGYIQEGNKMSFRILQQISKENKGSFVCSPLSLQMALAMTANGAEGETQQEMLDVLGYGHEGMGALNAYAHVLLDQLPALDLDVTL